ncbi:MAG: type II toxin-antitoxin system VapC family toxin [Actinomycetota bacterium]
MVGEAVHGPHRAGQIEARRSDRCGGHRRGSALTAYLDSSALVKAFVAEEGRDAVVEVLGEEICGTASIAYVECRAAFARRAREGYLSAIGQRTAIAELDAKWPTLIVIEADEQVIKGAGQLATASTLRAADAIHLESARVLASGSPTTVPFVCCDRRLWGAAKDAGFRVIPRTHP